MYQVESESSYQRPSLGDIERWGALGAGIAMVAYGLSLRSRSGAGIALLGVPLVYRGVADRFPGTVAKGTRIGPNGSDTREELAGEKGIHVRESIRIERPVEELYRFWRRLENLPRFMANLEQVTDLGGGRSRWVARGPADMRVQWDAEIINDVENKVIGWESLPGSDVSTAGSVTFESMRGGRSTEIFVHLQYAPPAGRVGSAVASLLGREPSQTIREDLRRLKQQLESDEVPSLSSRQPLRSPI